MLAKFKNLFKFDTEYQKILNDLNENYVEQEPDSMTNVSIGDYSYSRGFTYNGIKYGYRVTYYPKVKAIEIKFIDLDRMTFKTTNKIGVKASNVFGIVAGMTRRCLNELKEKNSMPEHIYFSTTDRNSLYGILARHKTTVALLNDFKYIADENYAKVIKDYIVNSENIRNKKREKEFSDKLTIFCFTKN